MEIKLNKGKIDTQNTYKPSQCHCRVCCTKQLQQMPGHLSKVLSKVTNPVISIESWQSNYCDNDNVSRPFISKNKPRFHQSDSHLKKQWRKKTHFTRPSRSPIYVECINPLVSITPMTKEVQSNINIYPKLKPRPMKIASSAKTVYEYKYPYSSSEENEEFSQFLPSVGSDCLGNDAYFKTVPPLHGDQYKTSSSLSKQRSSILNYSHENQIDLNNCQGFANEHDCVEGDIESVAIIDRPSQRDGSDDKVMSSNLETDFVLNKFSSRLEERLGIFLESISFRQSSTIKEESNYTKTPICELLQNSQTTHRKDSYSDIEEQTKCTQPTIISSKREFSNNEDELSCNSSLDIKAEVKFCNKCSQTEPFSQDNYLNKKEISINDHFDQNIKKDSMSIPETNLAEDENNYSCNKTERIAVEQKKDSKFSAKSKQDENDRNTRMNETFDVDQYNKKPSTAINFVDSYAPLDEAKSELPIVNTTNQQNLDEPTELPLFFNANNTCLTRNEISTQELNCIPQVNSVGSASPKQGVSNTIEIITNKNTSNKLSESFESIRIEEPDKDKHTGIPNENSNEHSLMDQISPKSWENTDEVNSCYSEKMESDKQDAEASIDHKIAPIDRTEILFTFPSTSEIEYLEVPESTYEVSSGEIFQPPIEIGDLTVSEGELGFEASLTSMLPMGHIAIKVTPKDTSLFESLPSFSLDIKSVKSIQISKETQTEFPISEQHLKNSKLDVTEFSWTKDADDTVSSGELIQDTDQTPRYTTTPEMENLLKENLKLRNKLSCYSGRFCLGFVRDPG